MEYIAYIGMVLGVNVGIYYMAYMECLSMDLEVFVILRLLLASLYMTPCHMSMCQTGQI